MKITLIIVAILVVTFKIDATPIPLQDSLSQNEFLYKAITMVCLVNKERVKAGVNPLVLDE